MRCPPCGQRLIHVTSPCRRKLDLRTAAQHIRSSVQRVQLRRQFLPLFLKIFHARRGSNGPTWWRTRTAPLVGFDRPWLHQSAHSCVGGAVWLLQSSSSLLIAVYGAVLETFPVDRASILTCTPRFLHQLSLFVFLGLLGGINSATSSLLEEEACGLS